MHAHRVAVVLLSVVVRGASSLVASLGRGRVASSLAMRPNTWGTSEWNWGSAAGEAHDEAAALRSSLAGEAARVAYLVALREGRVSDDSAALAFALTCQRRLGGRRGRVPRAFRDAYDDLVAGALARGGLPALARRAAPGVERYNLNVRLEVKADRRDAFLSVIEANAAGTLSEPRNLRYCWGESATTPNTFHFQESFAGKAGFDAHAAAPHFREWEAFAGTGPFAAEPAVDFYVPMTSAADDHAPCAVVAAALATLDFAPDGC